MMAVVRSCALINFEVCIPVKDLSILNKLVVVVVVIVIVV